MSKQTITPSTEALDAYFASFGSIDVRPTTPHAPLPKASGGVARTRSSVRLCLETLEGREMLSASPFGSAADNYDSALMWTPPAGSYETVSNELEVHATGTIANNSLVNIGEGVSMLVSTGTGGSTIVKDNALIAFNDAYDVLHGTAENPLGTDHMTFDFPTPLAGATAIRFKHGSTATPAQGNVLIDASNGRTTVAIPANGIIPWNPALGISAITLINVHSPGDLRAISLDGIDVTMYLPTTAQNTDALSTQVVSLTEQVADAQAALTTAQNTTPTPPAITNLPWPEGSDASAKILGKLNVHPGQSLYNIRFSPDGTHFVTASQDRTAKIWNAQTGALVRTLTGNTSLVMDAVWSKDGSSIWTSGYDKHVRQYSVSDGSLLWDSGELPSLALSAALSSDGATLLVDMHGVAPMTINTSSKQIGSLGDGFDWSEGVAAISDGTMLIGDGNGPTIIDPVTRAVIVRLTGLGNAASAVAASPNAQWIVAGGDSGALAIWNRSTGQKIQLPSQGSYVTSLAVSGDGNHVFVGSGSQVNAYDLRPLATNQVPTLLQTYTGIGSGPRGLAVQGKTVSAVTGDGNASRLVALDRSGLAGYTVPNPAADAAQATLTVLQGQLAQASSQLNLLQAQEAGRDDIMEIIARQRAASFSLERNDVVETTVQDRRIDAVLDIQTLGGSARLSSWQGVRTSVPSLERSQDGSLLFTGSAATLDLTQAAHRVTTVSFAVTTSTGNAATVRFLRGDNVLVTQTVQSGTTVSHSDSEGITGVIVQNEEVPLSQQVQDFLEYFNSNDGQFQANRYAWEWWNQNGFKSFPQFGGASLAYFAKTENSAVPDSQKWDILRSAAAGRQYATLNLQNIDIQGNTAQSQPTVPHSLETTPTGLLLNAPDWRQNDDTLRRGPSPGYLAVGRFDPYKVGVVRDQNQYSAITLNNLQGSATPQKVHYHTPGGDTELSSDYYRIVGRTVILYPGAPSQVVVYLQSGSTQDPGTVDIAHRQSANAEDIVPPEAMTIRTDILAIRNTGPAEGVSDGLSSVPDTGRAVTPSSGNVLLNVWNAGQTGGTVRVITNEGTSNAREVSFSLAGQAAKSVSLNFATPENGVLSVTVVLPDGRRVVDGRTLKLQGESSEKRVATRNADGTWTLEWKPASYNGPTVIDGGVVDPSFVAWKQERIAKGDVSVADPANYERAVVAFAEEREAQQTLLVVRESGGTPPISTVLPQALALYNPAQSVPGYLEDLVDSHGMVGKVILGTAQKLWLEQDTEARATIAANAKVITGVDANYLLAIPRDNIDVFARRVQSAFTKSGFGFLFTRNTLADVDGMRSSTDKPASRGGVITVRWDMDNDGKELHHVRLYIVDESTGKQYDFSGDLPPVFSFAVPADPIAKAGITKMHVKIVAWFSDANGQPTDDGRLWTTTGSLLVGEGSKTGSIMDVSTLPEGDLNRSVENAILNRIAASMPVDVSKGWYNLLGSPHHHGIYAEHAVDFNYGNVGADRDATIRAVDDGNISRLYRNDDDVTILVITHTLPTGQTWDSVYMHMPMVQRTDGSWDMMDSQGNVVATLKEGDDVVASQIIGANGNEGADGEHLHFEAHRGAWRESAAINLDGLFRSLSPVITTRILEGGPPNFQVTFDQNLQEWVNATDRIVADIVTVDGAAQIHMMAWNADGTVGERVEYRDLSNFKLPDGTLLGTYSGWVSVRADNTVWEWKDGDWRQLLTL